MAKFKCEEMMCDHCVARIKKGLEEAGLKNSVDLASKTVTVDGDESCTAKAKEVLDDLGYTPTEV